MLQRIWDAFIENFDHSRQGCYARALRRGEKKCIYGDGRMCNGYENYTEEDWKKRTLDIIEE